MLIFCVMLVLKDPNNLPVTEFSFLEYGEEICEVKIK